MQLMNHLIWSASSCWEVKGRGGGLAVSILAFHSNDPSLSPVGYFDFLYEKTKINKKEAGIGPSFFKCWEVYKKLPSQDAAG